MASVGSVDAIDRKTQVLKSLDSRVEQIKTDFRLSLFASALNSYRCDTILKPFPSDYVNSDINEKLFDCLVIIVLI